MRPYLFAICSMLYPGLGSFDNCNYTNTITILITRNISTLRHLLPMCSLTSHNSCIRSNCSLIIYQWVCWMFIDNKVFFCHSNKNVHIITVVRHVFRHTGFKSILQKLLLSHRLKNLIRMLLMYECEKWNDNYHQTEMPSWLCWVLFKFSFFHDTKCYLQQTSESIQTVTDCNVNRFTKYPVTMLVVSNNLHSINELKFTHRKDITIDKIQLYHSFCAPTLLVSWQFINQFILLKQSYK